MLLTQHEDLVTSRLNLIAITPAMLHAEQANDNSLGGLIRCKISPNGRLSTGSLTSSVHCSSSMNAVRNRF
jgi:hypothetical protein